LLQDAMVSLFSGFNFFGGSSLGTSGGDAWAGLRMANGGAFVGGNLMRFANGGAFTNSIVDRPTRFSFANGTAIGEMGEAGPEAIMPLRRLPSGRLGVESSGSAQRGSDIVQITVHVEGANGDQHVIDLVNQGVTNGLQKFDRYQEKRRQAGGE